MRRRGGNTAFSGSDQPKAFSLKRVHDPGWGNAKLGPHLQASSGLHPHEILQNCSIEGEEQSHPQTQSPSFPKQVSASSAMKVMMMVDGGEDGEGGEM